MTHRPLQYSDQVGRLITHFGEDLLNYRDEIELDMADDGMELIL